MYLNEHSFSSQILLETTAFLMLVCFFMCALCDHMVRTDVSHNFRHLGNFKHRCDTKNTA